jgi:predicted DNA-binding WGR domain protein
VHEQEVTTMLVDPGRCIAPDQDPTDADDGVALDAHDVVGRAASFSAYVRLTSIDPTRNRRRAYLMIWAPTLWGGGGLIRSWGRIGTRGRSIQTDHDDRASAQPLIIETLRTRALHGYHVVEIV